MAAAVSGRRADRLGAGGGSKGIVMSSFVIRPEQFTTLASFFMGGHKKGACGWPLLSQVLLYYL